MELYTDPAAMSPLSPDDNTGELTALALHVVENAARLSAAVHPLTGRAIATFLRPVNSYYSNLIEGHDTHPIEIEKALKQDYSTDKKKRSLQLEAKAHIETHQALDVKIRNTTTNPLDLDFLKWIHLEFYQHLPDEFRKAKSREGKLLDVIPGAWRTSEVEVGRHIAPAASHLEAFLNRYEQHYKGIFTYEKNRLNHIIAIAAAHHRLAWIHPFLDGNGRVIRLLTDALFITAGLDANGLWSMSRGLARHHQAYKAHLANADLQRENDYDGRGNLSNKHLVAFCRFFLEVANDQLQYMSQVMNTDNMLKRIHSFVDLMVTRGKFKTETRYILEQVFLKGEIGRREVERLTGKSDKTAKGMADTLIREGLLTTDPGNRFAPYRVAYPITFSPVLFSGLFPRDKEIGLLDAFSS